MLPKQAGTDPLAWEGRVGIIGEEARAGPATAGAAAHPAAGPRAGAGLPGRRSRRRRAWITLGVAAVVLAGFNVYGAYVVTSARNAAVAANVRVSGIPRNISTSLANLMQLSAIHDTRAPGFTFTDQRGRATSLASLRGKVVVLGFMDSRCADICPVLSREVIEAYRKLGADARKVVFAVVNVDPDFASVRDVAISSAQHHLTTIPDWHFFTGGGPALRAVWHAYHIDVYAPNPVVGLVHTSTLFFIDPHGVERFLASPMVGFSLWRNSHLPPGQIAAWASGIARLAQDLAR
jgi:cytochrome oxidase Cu insertion factor (SCO1/SenC/PrrC family)